MCILSILLLSSKSFCHGNALDKPLHDPGDTSVATKGIVPRSSSPSGGRTSEAPHAVKPAGAAPCKEVPQGPGLLWVYTRKLSCYSSARQAFVSCVLKLSQLMPRNPQHVSIKGSGQDSSVGVMEGILLHVRPLFSRNLSFPLSL